MASAIFGNRRCANGRAHNILSTPMEFLKPERQRAAVTFIGLASMVGLFMSTYAVFAAATDQSIEQGVFLIANPVLEDPRFQKTVVFVWAHGTDGTHGLVINRPTSAKLSNVLPTVDAFKKLAMTVYFGGPVDRTVPILLFRHAGHPPIGQHVVRDLYITTDLDSLTASPDVPLLEDRFRVYSGYAGWAPGQLAAEMSRGAWRVSRGDTPYIFSEHPGTVWEDLMSASGAMQVWNSHLPCSPHTHHSLSPQCFPLYH